MIKNHERCKYERICFLTEETPRHQNKNLLLVQFCSISIEKKKTIYNLTKKKKTEEENKKKIMRTVNET